MTLEQELIIQKWARKMYNKPIQEVEKIKRGTISSVSQRLKPFDGKSK